MTLSGPSIPIAMAEATDTRLLAIDELDLHLLAGHKFDAVADSVGRLREATYRQQLSGSGDERDLDGRDAHYDHLLLVERKSGSLAGAARLQFIPAGSTELPGREGSYLEHVYPGIKAQLAAQQNHLEIGRVALAQRFQRQPHSLMALFRGGILLAALSGYDLLHGLVSYNHFAQSDSVNTAFLTAMMRPPYRRQGMDLPVPRHPIADIAPNDNPHPSGNIQALEQEIRRQYSEDFRLPVLLRQYFNLMEAKVCDLSVARDFNQITEILMVANLRDLPPERLALFIDLPHQPLYQQFSWYRGEK